jgi:hypothetical protein
MDVSRVGRWPALLALGLALGAPGAAAAQDPPASPPPAEAPAALDPSHRPTVRILPFGSADFTSESEDSGHSSFAIGPFDLYITASLSEHWSALGEIVFENGDNSLATDLERFLVAWQASDLLRLRAGREHNPLVRWNTALHHGVYMQTPVDRPSMARFEDDGGPWPVHFVGLLADGMAGRTGLRYGAAVGNGRGAIPDEIDVTFDRNGSKALIGWLGWEPPAVVGLELSLTGYADRIPAESGELRERGWTASGSYVAHQWELRSEYGQLDHRTADGSATFRTTGWYALAAFELPRVPVKPYVMLDHMDVPEADPFLFGIPDREGFVVGVRWDPDRRAAVKAEVLSQRVGDGDRQTTLRAQLAVAF